MARLDRVNARVGARRSALIGPEGLRDLLLGPTLAARISLLVGSGRLPEPPSPATLGAVEGALRTRLREDEALLLREVEGARPRRLLASAFGLEEARAIKVLLRGVATGAPPERTCALAPVSAALPAAVIATLARAASPEALAERLAAIGSPYAAAVRGALGARDRHGLLPAELAIDRAAHGRVEEAAAGLGEDARLLRDWLAERTDLRNATTLLSLGAALPERDLFLPGGARLGRATFEALAREEPPGRRVALAARVPCEAARLADPATAERLLEQVTVRRLTQRARRAPLSLAVPLAWMEARREEVRRIALLLRGAELGMGGDAILELVGA
jgi:V/A-type H+-transporting ATPase subunit C